MKNGFEDYNVTLKYKLYKISDLSDPNSTIYKYLQNIGFFDLTNADQYAEANKKINFLWDSPLEYEIYDPTQFYHPALQQALTIREHHELPAKIHFRQGFLLQLKHKLSANTLI